MFDLKKLQVRLSISSQAKTDSYNSPVGTSYTVPLTASYNAPVSKVPLISHQHNVKVGVIVKLHRFCF